MSTEIPEVKIALTDDHILLRNALAQLINNFEGFKVILEASTGDELLKKMHAGIVPDLILLDLQMPGLGGRETAKRIREEFPAVYVMMLTMYDTEFTMIQLMQVGVRGFPKKDLDPMQLKYALNEVMEHGYYYSTDTTGKLMNIIQKRHEAHSFLRKMLTELEIIFLKHTCMSLTYKEIASSMSLHERAIEGLREGLFDKLEIRSRVGLAMFAVKHGIFAF